MPNEAAETKKKKGLMKEGKIVMLGEEPIVSGRLFALERDGVSLVSHCDELQYCYFCGQDDGSQNVPPRGTRSPHAGSSDRTNPEQRRTGPFEREAKLKGFVKRR